MKLLPPQELHEDDESYVIPHSRKKLDDEVEQFRVTQKAQAKMRKAGLPKPEQYIKDDEPLNPRLTLKLASIDNKALGRLMAEFTASCEYATYAAAIADIDRTIALNILEFVEAKVRLSKSGETVQRRADKTKVDPRVVQARTDYMEKDALSTLTAAMQKNYERGLSTISREITRRQSELDNS